VAVQDLREVKYISKGIYFYNRQLDDEKFIMKEIKSNKKKVFSKLLFLYFHGHAIIFLISWSRDS
jgi:hypothetical protein